MHVQTKFLRLCEPVSLGEQIDDWRVCWLGGWDKCRVFFIVMVEREHEEPVELPEPRMQSQDPLPSGDRERGIIATSA
jgi:hypothetical protein